MAVRPTLILVAGLLLTAGFWRRQVAALADRVDCRATDAHWRHDDLSAIARAILAEAPPRFALAGLSMGGYVCFEILRQAADRVERLALLDTQAGPDTAEVAARRRGLIQLAGTGRFLGVTDRLLPLLGQPDRLAEPSLTNEIKEMAQSVGREGFLRQQKTIMARPDSRPDLARIDCPTLLLCGRQDALTPLSAHEEMQAGIAGSRLVVVDDCGHLPPLERPQETTAALRRWLSAD
ncbi:MAG: alpha/beta hydrolase [Alphaproteobacteria bacterium]|nr:alpha/beta hydrolase [Alphaproteobacteria bacterium]